MRFITRSMSFIVAILSLFPAQAASRSPAFPPITGFELSRFLGKWYEIARIPNSFERDLVNVTATYELRSDGKVKVLNQGNKLAPEGKHSKAIGKAKFASTPDTGYLRVSFFGPFYGDYIIAELDSAYQYALIASSPDLLWILCRTPALDEETLTKLKARAAELGFDTSRLKPTLQQW